MCEYARQSPSHYKNVHFSVLCRLLTFTHNSPTYTNSTFKTRLRNSNILFGLVRCCECVTPHTAFHLFLSFDLIPKKMSNFISTQFKMSTCKYSAFLFFFLNFEPQTFSILFFCHLLCVCVCARFRNKKQNKNKWAYCFRHLIAILVSLQRVLKRWKWSIMVHTSSVWWFFVEIFWWFAIDF